ncbi:MAG: hypothetical protein SFZ03_03095 [Candidatus Melainabacteria bacterium]|nr:hypothetical protein [Candidatus Melainabacteria bacterium]
MPGQTSRRNAAAGVTTFNHTEPFAHQPDVERSSQRFGHMPHEASSVPDWANAVMMGVLMGVGMDAWHWFRESLQKQVVSRLHRQQPEAAAPSDAVSSESSEDRVA